MKEGVNNNGFTSDQDVINNGFNNDHAPGKNIDDNNFDLQLTPLENVAPVAEPPADPPPVAFSQLFRYATLYEKALVVAGLLFGVATGVCVPFFIVLYGEYTSMLVERNMENITSSEVPVLAFFGGGRILVGGTFDERMVALMEDAVAFAIGCVTCSSVQFVLGASTVACLNYTAIKQVSRVRLMFMTSLLRQDQAWHDTRGTSNVATRLTEDLDKLQDGIGEKIGIFMFLVVSFVSSIIMALIAGWKLTLVVLSCAPVIIVAQAVVAKMQGSLTVQEQASYGSAGAVVEEVLGAIRTVIAFGGEQKEAVRYSEKLEPARAMGTKKGLYSGLGGGVMWFIIYCSYGLAFWYGVTLILEDRGSEDPTYTAGIIVIVLFGVLAGAMNMGLASPHLEAFNVARGAASAVYSVIEHVPHIDSLSEEGVRPANITGDVQLNDVHFQYPARRDVKVLLGFSLRITHGQTVALVGHSGCGKSTVVQLIQRLYDPSRGSVTLDGVDLRDLNVQWLRRNIGVVGQEPVLFDTTIRENIRFGTEHATDLEIEEAARVANAHDFISRLPLGYNTMVGERGAQLSGGQKQRVAIARAIVRQPAILLLDEATSALDRASEVKVQAALDAASRGRTTIVVTHRLATIRFADCIVVLKDGVVVEQGNHDQLMKQEGRYHALVTADTSGVEKTADKPTQEAATVHKRVSVASLENRKMSRQSVKGADTLDVKEEEETYPAPFGRIMALNKPETAHIVVGCISSMVVGCSLPAFAVLFGSVYGVLSLEDPAEVRAQTDIYSILFVVIGILAGLGTFLQTYLFGLVGVRLTTRLRTTVFSAILQQEVGWFDDEKNSVGALCARLAGDAASVQGATGTRLAVILQAVSTLLIGVAVAMYFSWQMTLVSLISIPVVLGGVFVESRMMASQGLAAKKALEGATKVAVEAISQVRTVASLSSEQAVLQRYEKELNEAERASHKKVRMRGVVFSMGQSMPFMCYALVFWYGGLLVSTQGMPYENVIIVAEALIFGAWMLGQSLAYAPNFSTARVSAGRLFSLLDRKPLVAGPMYDASNVQSLEGDVSFSKIEFSYPTRADVKVLRGLDLLIRPGQTVALVGASGCGKSTCVQLLQRLYDPSAGTVSMGQHDIATVPLSQLRRRLGIVSQEPVLFDRTIEENIAYGDNERDVSTHEVVEAAQKANIHGFISSLPQGYNTRLGAKGTQLSGGQKQRVAIARALLRNPRILLLDEATSALDTQSEKVVQLALDKAREGRTCITIAHRLSTIQNADLICVLDQGVIVESGKHAELLRLNGHYAHLQQQADMA